MATIRDWYLKTLLKNLSLILEQWDDQQGVFTLKGKWVDHCTHGLRVWAYFCTHQEPGNPYYQDDAVVERVGRAGDYLVADTEKEDPGTTGRLGAEWLALNLLESLEMLGDRLGSERVARWQAALREHMDYLKQINNYIVAAPNHIIWRMALLYRAGLYFDDAGYRETATFIARQAARMQTADGYWDESRRGHGPSPNYHRTQIHGLDLYQRWSGDEAVLPALEKGIELAVRMAYPDGTPIDTFDGRQPYLAAFAVGMAANALSRTARGRRLLRLQNKRLDELSICDGRSPTGFAVAWYLYAATDFMLDCLRYCQEGDEQALPAEADSHRDTFMLSGDGVIGGGTVRRSGDWTLAVSACQSDIPRLTNHVYNCERQNGFSLHHASAGLLVGGGNRTRNHAPLCNAHVITGWQGVDVQGGRYEDRFVPNHGMPILADGTDTAPKTPVKGCYLPIRRQVEHTDRGARLTLDFMHASIRFDLLLLDDRHAAVDYAFESAGVKKILLQVPVPIFHPHRFKLNGTNQRLGDIEDVRTLDVGTGLTVEAGGKTVRYLPAEQAAMQFTWPLEPIKNWKLKKMNYIPDEFYAPLYAIGLMIREFKTASAHGRLLTVEVS